MGTAAAHYGCGCSTTMTMGGGPIVSVQVCQRHREHACVKAALEAQQRALRELGAAMRLAHNDVSPLEIEQAERGEERYR